jgi:glycosyltransferase involved in cell wall biosynthesis
MSALADAIISMIKDTELRNRLTENALKHSKQFSWDNAAKVFFDIIERETGV